MSTPYTPYTVNLVQSSLATLQVQVPISAILNGSTNYNMTADEVQLAFIVPGRNPSGGDWNDGTWVINPGPEYTAQCLVGPDNDGVVLGVGRYTIWVKVIDDPEIFIPAGGVGTLTIE